MSDMNESSNHVPILQADNVTVDYDGFKALQDLTFSMDYPELRVVIGPNGAGKSTFMDVITGKVRPAAGTLHFQVDGQSIDLTKLREHEIATLGIGRKFQTPSVFGNLTVWENLDISLKRKSKGLFSTLFSKATPSQAERIQEVLNTIGLSEKEHAMAGALSHGQKQWLEIGMVLIQNPKLLLIDEPVAGMTEQETDKTGELLNSLAVDHSVVVIEHDMEFVRQIAKKVTVLHEGSVLVEGPMESVQADPKIMEIYLGRAGGIDAST